MSIFATAAGTAIGVIGGNQVKKFIDGLGKGSPGRKPGAPRDSKGQYLPKKGKRKTTSSRKTTASASSAKASSRKTTSNKSKAPAKKRRTSTRKRSASTANKKPGC